MLCSACKWICCLLILASWSFTAQGVEASIPYPISNIYKQDCADSQDELSDCDKQFGEDELYQSYENQMLEYFSDIVFENSFCKCDGNNGCTRGCRLTKYLDQDQSPPFRQCKGKKSMRRSSEHCAKHVTGAIMTVIHDFLGDHCQSIGEKMPENRTDYHKCEKDFIKNANRGNTSLCQHGFIFPYAFCMLNLTGEGLHVYNKIPRIRRSKCKRWDQYNQSLLTMETSPHYGDIKSIPLFQKVSPERNEEFRKAPHKIPEGAIIVTRIYREEGHVEIKTNRKECGKNKTETCFCSDHCVERKSYHSPVLAVFKWNPKFIKYLSRIRIE